MMYSTTTYRSQHLPADEGRAVPGRCAVPGRALVPGRSTDPGLSADPGRAVIVFALLAADWGRRAEPGL